MGVPLKQENAHYTYADYCAWDTDERYELIDGEPYLMSPAPKVSHQRVIKKLLIKLEQHFEGAPCEALQAPIDVRLNPDGDDDTVVQPDIVVVCDPAQVSDDSGVKGAPELVVEVLSRSTRAYDTGAKLDLYLAAGVKECWMVNPESGIVRVYTQDQDGTQRMTAYRKTDTLTSVAFPELRIALAEIFGA